MRETPKRPVPDAAGADIPIRVNVAPDDPLAEVERMRKSRATETSGRSVYLKKEDFEQFGYTDGCEGCRRMRSGGLRHKNHTPACRRRMEACLNEARHPRFERALDRRLAEYDASGMASGVASGSGWTPRERKRGREEADKVGETEEAVAGAPVGDGGGLASDASPATETVGAHISVDTDVSGPEKRQASKEGDQDRKGGKIEVEQANKRGASKQTAGDEKRSMTGGSDAMVLSKLQQSIRALDMCELDSAPRVAEEAKKYKLKVREFMDPTTGWDFSKAANRRKAEEYIEANKPL